MSSLRYLQIGRQWDGAYSSGTSRNSERLLLTSFTYDPSAPSHIQTFPVDNEIVEMGLDVGIVIFQVLSNWGGDFTCLYRVSWRPARRK